MAGSGESPSPKEDTMIHFRATETTCDQIKPGEMFSTAGPEYWENTSPHAIGEKVYLRSNGPCPPADANEPIFRIEVEEEPDGAD